MNKKEKKIILATDPDAVQEVTVKAYKCPDGYLYFDEQVARHYSSTHLECSECTTIYPKNGRTLCKYCEEKSEQKKWEEMPHQEWDEEAPLYCNKNEKFFFNREEIEEFLSEYNLVPKDLRLIICEPCKLKEIETDYWSDDIVDDPLEQSFEDRYPEIYQAIQEVNRLINEAGATSYFPTGKYRTEFKAGIL